MSAHASHQSLSTDDGSHKLSRRSMAFGIQDPLAPAIRWSFSTTSGASAAVMDERRKIS